MRSLFGLLVSSLILIFLGVFTWSHLRKSADTTEIKAAPLIERAREAQQASSDSEESAHGVTMVGPLANYMSHQDGDLADKIETIPYKPVASDYVGGSVVGTGSTILHQSFPVANTVDLPFEVSAHAYNPKFHGSFRSFARAAGKPLSDPSAGDVEFLLLTDKQFADLLEGRPSESIFSADAAHNQEVNANLPPTMNQPAKYHLIFRNGAHDVKKIVEADFRVDY